MDISMVHDPLPNLGHNVWQKKNAEKCINTYDGQNKKVSGNTIAKPCKNLHAVFSVNKPKFSESKHDESDLSTHIYTKYK